MTSERLKGPYGRCEPCGIVWAMEGRKLNVERNRHGRMVGRLCPQCGRFTHQTALRLMIAPDVRPWQDMRAKARGDVR